MTDPHPTVKAALDARTYRVEIANDIGMSRYLAAAFRERAEHYRALADDAEDTTTRVLRLAIAEKIEETANEIEETT